MAGFRKKQRKQLIVGGLVLLVAATTLIGYAMRDGIQYFKSPSDIANAPPDPEQAIRIGGMVVLGSLARNSVADVEFVVTDCVNKVPVHYVGSEEPPALFGEGKGVVAEGVFVDGVFRADRILAKHDEDYMPKEVADALGDRSQDCVKGA